MSQTFDEFINKTRTTVIFARKDNMNVGDHRVTLDTAWWQAVCRHLWDEVETLKKELGVGSDEAVKRGPGRPPKVATV